MAVTRVQLNTLFGMIETLDENKKTISAEIKEAFKLFAEQNGDGDQKTFTKALKKAYRNYKELSKDRAEFIIVETEADSMTEALLSEGNTNTAIAE
jgi:uncharacterized protein (UPF0335 family)